ncbi:MAG: heparan-alpha-glucosaminide N-acetyltransferase domain-containing protein [Acidobacteriota bacterium]
MTATAQVSPSTGITGQTTSTRVVSIDIFRGITMAVMIFVNDLDSVHGLSQWTYHMPANVNAMSYVDMVYPAFLFIVGMSLPLAVRQRLKRSPSVAKLWLHVILRSAALLALGLILANADRGDPARMHLSRGLWALLGLGGGILLWNVYSGLSRRVVLMLRMAGAALLVFVFAIFRRATPGGEAWLGFSYPEILGLIGLTYLAVCLLYIPTRRWRMAPVVWLLVLVAYNCVCCAHWIDVDRISLYLWPFGNGCMASLIMAGVVTSLIFLDDGRSRGPARKLQLGLLMGILAFVAGWFLRPLGISKIRATPTWALWTVAACCVLFSALYWLCDLKKRTGWAWLVRPAGSNTLLTYLIPDIYYFVVAVTGTAYLQEHWNHGWPGAIRAVAFTVAILLVAHAATRARLRMQL